MKKKNFFSFKAICDVKSFKLKHFWTWIFSDIFLYKLFCTYCMADYPEYVWICLIMLDYAWISLNLPKWLFVYIWENIIPDLLERVINVYTKQEGTWGFFLEEKKCDFYNFYNSWKHLIFFCKRLNILTSKISNFFLSLGAKEADARESWYIWNYHRMNKS